MKQPGSFWQKLMFILALGTTLSPIDAIPDIIPMLGQADDALAILLLIFMGIRMLYNRWQEKNPRGWNSRGNTNQWNDNNQRNTWQGN